MIQVLDQKTINQIAAGEVVERPSAVVKELMDNSLDAGASAITIEIKEGGISMIRITDNGAGIAKEDLKIGAIYIGDENEGYSANHLNGLKEAQAALGISDDQVLCKYNVPETEDAYEAAIDLAEQGCNIIFATSFGHESYVFQAAAEYPNIQFCQATGNSAMNSELTNVHNYFYAVYESRYVSGVVAGMKLAQMIEDGTITAENAKIGYVGAFPFAEVISGFTAYYLGAKSVCPSVTMKVQFVGSWSDATEEANAASALCDAGCVMISQHSDNTTPATMAQSKGAFHTGYNNDMTGVAPDASIIGCRIGWTNYFVYAIESVANGQEFDQDYCYGYDHGDVVLTELNEKIAAPGTAEKLAEVEAGLADGSIKVFDTSTFTVDGETLTSAFALDTDGDFTPDSEEAVFDGAFHESYFQSAPYFAIKIDGIEWLNSAF